VRPKNDPARSAAYRTIRSDDQPAAMSVRLYTLYSDIPPASEDAIGTPEFAAAREKASARDRLIRAWLQRSSIGTFPKSERELSMWLPTFTAYSERNPFLNFVFVSDTGNVVTLNRGNLQCQSNYEEAVRDVYTLSNETPLVTHRNVVFPKYRDGSANPGIPPTDAP
jgi:hypothetical protein